MLGERSRRGQDWWAAAAAAVCTQARRALCSLSARQATASRRTGCTLMEGMEEQGLLLGHAGATPCTSTGMRACTDGGTPPPLHLLSHPLRKMSRHSAWSVTRTDTVPSASRLLHTLPASSSAE